MNLYWIGNCNSAQLRLYQEVKHSMTDVVCVKYNMFKYIPLNYLKFKTWNVETDQIKMRNLPCHKSIELFTGLIFSCLTVWMWNSQSQILDKFPYFVDKDVK